MVSYGGGANSTALLIGLHQHRIPVDLILFADTGAEHPHTYAYLEAMDRWLKDHGMPPITRVYKTTRDGKRLTLEDECLQSCSLPSISITSYARAVSIPASKVSGRWWCPVRTIFPAVPKSVGIRAQNGCRNRLWRLFPCRGSRFLLTPIQGRKWAICDIFITKRECWGEGQAADTQPPMNKLKKKMIGNERELKNYNFEKSCKTK